jgi:hypothetical protein
MKPRKSFPLRLSPELYQALEAWAQQEMRSVNGQIEYLLKEAVKRRDRSFEEQDNSEPSAGNCPGFRVGEDGAVPVPPAASPQSPR